MKKFYSTAIAALCALGVSATINVDRIRTNFSTENKKASEQVVKADREMRNQMRKNATMKKIASRAGEEQSIAGEYLIVLGDYFFEESLGTIETTATIEQEGAEISIDCDYFPSKVVADYDEATGEITFEMRKLGQVNDTTYARVEPYEYNLETGKLDVGSFTATYYAEEGYVEFPSYHGISWVAYKDSRYSMPDGYFDIFMFEEMEKVSNWQSLGAAVFTDNALAPAFEESVDPYAVDIYKSTVYDEFYKVINPWKGLYEALDFDAESPKIYLDAAEADNVLLYQESTGIGYNGVPYIIMNDGFFCWYYDKTATPDAYTTLKVEGDIATFAFEPSSLLMGYGSDLYPLGEEASTIVFYANGNAGESSGVSDIAIDENAPVEYFNLQGVRIDNPAAGQIVIKRQGAKVTKTIVR